MTEAAFTKINLRRWQEFEAALEKPSGKDPDRLKELYLQLTDDLAFAETHFARGEITQYLHNLTAKVHKQVYVNKKENTARFLSFWKYEVPEIAYRYRKMLLYSLIIFVLAMTVGAFSAANDPTYVRLIMGDAYVNMTEENIANNDPMAVYKNMRQDDMFLAITVNNIRVSLLAFAAGVLTSVATGLLLFYNGIMLGAFQYFFFQKGLFLTSFLTIWIHGTLEISAIIIAGGAGLIMGNSFVFPGTLPRCEAGDRLDSGVYYCGFFGELCNSPYRHAHRA
jgi:uncharacterized membrane protein SpoIIM required for sporulation